MNDRKDPILYIVIPCYNEPVSYTHLTLPTNSRV